MNKTIRILLTCYSAAACSMSLLGMQESLQFPEHIQESKSISKEISELDDRMRTIENVLKEHSERSRQLETRIDEIERLIQKICAETQAQGKISDYICARQKEICEEQEETSNKIKNLNQKIWDLMNDLSDLYESLGYQDSESYEKFENENSDFIQPPKVRSFGDREYKGNLPHSEGIKEDKEGEDSSITAFNPSQEVSSDSTDEIIRLKHKSCKF